MKDVIKRLRGFVQMVSDIVIDDDGNATCTGVGDDQEEDSYSPTVAYHFGFYSRPSKARGVIFKADGRGNTSFLVGFRDKQYELTLQKGEVGIKNEFDASILLDKNGQIVLNEGTEKVARVGDHGDAGSLVLAFSPGTGGASLTVTYHDPDGNTTVLSTGSGTIALKNKNTEGADKVKA